MHWAIYFNHQFCLWAVKINDISTDQVLPPELNLSKLP